MRTIYVICVVFFVFARIAHADTSQTGSPSSPNQQPSAFDRIQALNWQYGPVTEDIGSDAKIIIPNGYAFLGPNSTKSFMAINKNPVDSSPEYTLAPTSLNWFSIIEWNNVGYVNDTDKLNPDKILNEIVIGTNKENTVRISRGWPTLNISGWIYKPNYDTEKHLLEWAVDSESSTGQKVSNYSVRILGRDGYTSFIMVGDPSKISVNAKALNVVLSGFHYNKGENYSDYTDGDKLAGYGLAALITGGAAAVAVKTGIFAGIIAALVGLWKILIVIPLLALAYIKNLFRRKK